VRALRGRPLLHDVDIGYTSTIDAKFFALEAQLLLRELREWESMFRADQDALLSEKIEAGPEWMPPDYQDGWPRTGCMYAISPPAELIPPLGKPGRPRIRPRRLQDRSAKRATQEYEDEQIAKVDLTAHLRKLRLAKKAERAAEGLFPTGTKPKHSGESTDHSGESTD
jgi:hypothetical protein